jgi:hypothetical protein
MPVSTYTTGAKITCSSNGAAAQKTVARFRIGGSSPAGTIYEGCIAAGPQDITTPSGGTYRYDGTNNNANPAPRGTMTTAIDAAGRLNGFGFDRSYSSQFQDFFITTIAGRAQTSTQFWGLLRDFQFTPTGGCQSLNSPGKGLRAFDAFNKRYFLRLPSDYAVVRPGDAVSLTVLYGSTDTLISGASFAGQISGAGGSVTFNAPSTPGCYQYKAERGDSIRSSAFYLTVI